MKTSGSFPLTAISFCVVACSAPAPPPPPPPPPPVDMEVVTEEIQALEDAYAAAVVNKDADAVVAYYADDAVSYHNEAEPLKGKENMRQEIAERMKNDSSGVTPSFTVEELFVGKDHITEVGSWIDTDTTGAVVDKGTYFSIFEKRNDAWVCVRDIAVSHMPKKEDDSSED